MKADGRGGTARCPDVAGSDQGRKTALVEFADERLDRLRQKDRDRSPSMPVQHDRTVDHLHRPDPIVSSQHSPQVDRYRTVIDITGNPLDSLVDQSRGNRSTCGSELDQECSHLPPQDPPTNNLADRP